MQLKGIIRLISQINRVSQVSQKYVFADVGRRVVSTIPVRDNLAGKVRA